MNQGLKHRKRAKPRQDRDRVGDADVVSLYMHDVKQRARLTHDEEETVVRELIAHREGLAELERAASSGLTPDDAERVAAAIAEKRGWIEHAKARLVESNLRLVVYLARRQSWAGAELADLVQEGNLALMRAVDHYDPDRGLTFGNFASMSIRHAIERCGATAKQLVRIPEEVRLRRRRVLKAVEHLSDREGRVPGLDTVAAYLDVSTVKVADAIENEPTTCSLDACIDGIVPGASGMVHASDVDAIDAIVASEDECLVREQIAKLDDRKRRLIEARYGEEPSTLAHIGRGLGITRERARQLEAQALYELRTGASAPQRVPRAAHAGGDSPGFLERAPQTNLRGQRA